MIVIIMGNIMVTKRPSTFEQETNKSSALGNSSPLLTGPSWCCVKLRFRVFCSFTLFLLFFLGRFLLFCFQLFFFFPSFYPFPSNLMGLTRTSEYWAPNLPGQPAVTLELSGSISIFARNFYCLVYVNTWGILPSGLFLFKIYWWLLCMFSTILN